LLNSVNLLTMQLESKMLESLMKSTKMESNLSSSVSFSDMLDSAINGLSGENLTAPVDNSETHDAGTMTVSDNMIKFIEEHEGFSSTAYRGVDSWNRTIGYGHVERAGEHFETLTKSEAEQLLRNDLKKYEASVNKEFAGVNLTQSQFDALVSFSYNLGANIWSKTPKLVSDIKSGAPLDVIREDMLRCSHVGGKVVQGLLNRRYDEWKVFAFGDYSG
jgi:Phage lysozyme.